MDQKQEQTHRVLVADDERVIRQGLQVLITRYYRELTVLEASNGQECWDILSTELQIRLAFVDIRMPEINGLQICEKTKMAGLPVKIVIISGFRDFDYARQALRCYRSILDRHGGALRQVRQHGMRSIAEQRDHVL